MERRRVQPGGGLQKARRLLVEAGLQLARRVAGRWALVLQQLLQALAGFEQLATDRLSHQKRRCSAGLSVLRLLFQRVGVQPLAPPPPVPSKIAQQAAHWLLLLQGRQPQGTEGSHLHRVERHVGWGLLEARLQHQRCQRAARVWVGAPLSARMRPLPLLRQKQHETVSCAGGGERKPEPEPEPSITIPLI